MTTLELNPHEVQISPRRTLVRHASECSLRGRRGRFVFQYARVDASGQLELTFYGGPSGRGQFTSVYSESVKVLHRKRRSRSLSAKPVKLKGVI